MKWEESAKEKLRYAVLYFADLISHIQTLNMLEGAGVGGSLMNPSIFANLNHSHGHKFLQKVSKCLFCSTDPGAWFCVLLSFKLHFNYYLTCS